MYNRYVPGSNGVYERQTVPEPPKPCPTPVRDVKEECTQEVKQQRDHQHQTVCFGMDLGDLLLLCVVILLLLDSDEDDLIPLLIMAAAFLLQQ